MPSERRTDASDLPVGEPALPAEVLAIARIGYWVWDLKTDRSRWSQEMFRILGQDCSLAPGEVVAASRHLHEIHPDDRPRVEAELQAAFDGRAPYETTYRVLRPGELLEVYVRGEVFRDAEGRPERMAGILQDITEQQAKIRALQETQHRHEAEIERLLEERLDAEHLKDSFLAVVSHELRTPLNFITGFTSLLQDGMAGELNDQQSQFVTKIAQASDRMLRLISNLLDASMMAAGRFEISTSPTRHRTLVEETLARFELLASDKRVGLYADVQADGEFVMDGQRMLQVLIILVDNALKFTPDGGTVSVRTYLDGEHLVTEVEDDGEGIDLETQAKLFRPFSQADQTTTRRHGGVGLGLMIARTIIAAHGGRLELSSRPGDGCQVKVLLPIVRPGS